MWRLSAVLFLCLVPLLASADVRITEIMYDREGADADREWVEVHNDTNKAIDLSKWHFHEGDTDHRIERYKSDDGMLPAGARAVIADDAARVKTEYPDTFTYLFDSSFSLNNTGETLILKDGNDTEVSQVTYSTSQGAAGDGNSLQRNGADWIAAFPTPGAAFHQNTNTEEGTENKTDESNEDSQSTQSDKNDTGGKEDESSITTTHASWPAKPQIHARVKAEHGKIIAGAPTEYTGEALGLSGDLLTEGVRYGWGLGDGTYKEGKTITHHYVYPGTYVIALSVAVGKYAAYDYFTQTVIPADLRLRIGSERNRRYVALKNNTDSRLNISRWRLVSKGDVFTIPEPTFILPDTEIKFATGILGFRVSNNDTIILAYPNGNIATHTTNVRNGSLFPQPSQGMEDNTNQNENQAQRQQLLASHKSQPEEIHSYHTYHNVFREKDLPQTGVNAETLQTVPQASVSEKSPNLPSNPEAQTAQVLNNSHDNPFLWWVLGLIAVIGLALASFLLARTQNSEGSANSSTSAQPLSADEFEIVEED